MIANTVLTNHAFPREIPMVGSGQAGELEGARLNSAASVVGQPTGIITSPEVSTKSYLSRPKSGRFLRAARPGRFMMFAATATMDHIAATTMLSQSCSKGLWKEMELAGC
jgi:hypothetical protein